MIIDDFTTKDQLKRELVTSMFTLANYRVGKGDQVYISLWRNNPSGGLKIFSGYARSFAALDKNDIIQINLSNGIMFFNLDDLVEIADDASEFTFVIKTA